jgi:hypothetical protein
VHAHTLEIRTAHCSRCQLCREPSDRLDGCNGDACGSGAHDRAGHSGQTTSEPTDTPQSVTSSSSDETWGPTATAGRWTRRAWRHMVDQGIASMRMHTRTRLSARTWWRGGRMRWCGEEDESCVRRDLDLRARAREHLNTRDQTEQQATTRGTGSLLHHQSACKRTHACLSSCAHTIQSRPNDLRR